VITAMQATVYMEPQPVVELNNLEAMLADQVAEEELRILAALSMQVCAPIDTFLANFWQGRFSTACLHDVYKHVWPLV